MYAGGAVYTGDEIAAAVLEYARELARNATADTVFIPARTLAGDAGRVELMLGPSSQLLSEPLGLFGSEIEDEALVARLHRLSSKLAAHRPGHDQPFIQSEFPEGLS